MHASEEQARVIADKIEKEAYDGISTKEILQKIFKYMRKYRPAVRYHIDLREALSMLRPKPDFEIFVARVFEELGYETEHNKILRGKCVEHEIDAIAKKGKEVLYVEVKHHVNHHTYTGLNVMLQVRASFEDLKEGYEEGFHAYDFSRAMVVCNTKFSDHALRYANCRGIEYLGWRAPSDRGLEKLMEEKKLYPITYIRGLKRWERDRFGDVGIVMVKQLVEMDLSEMRRKTGIAKQRLRELVRKAREILS